jgi:transposase-like protein
MPRKVYTEEFKREAVRLAIERGNMAHVARDLGISDNTLQGWKSQRDKTPDNPFPGNGNPKRRRNGANATRECPPQGGKRNP